MNVPMHFHYQWSRDGQPIPGANGPTYALQHADQGAVVTVTVTAVNAAGSRSATSPPTTLIAAPPINLLTGDAADFEGGAGYWVVSAGNGVTSLAASAAEAHTGNQSLAVTARAAGTTAVQSPVIDSGANGLVSTSPVQAGTMVAPSCWVRPGSTARTVQIQVLWWQGTSSSPTFLAAPVVFSGQESPGGWVQLTGPAVSAPDGANGVSLQVFVVGCAAGEVHYIDTAALMATDLAPGFQSPPPSTVPADGRFGIYMPEAAYTRAGISSIEAMIGRRVDLLIDYQNWDNGTSAIPTLPAVVMAGIGKRDYMWTIQPSSGPCGASPGNCVNFGQLIEGAYDAQIVAFADWINQVWGPPSPSRGRFYVRFAHEMNGTGWYDWQVGGSCGVTSPQMYAEGFDHFATVLTAHTEYAQLVFAPNCGPTDNIADFYPAECDILGMDGYNNVSSALWETDTTVFAATYQVLAGLDPTKEIWICETACSEPTLPWTYDGVVYPATSPTDSKATWVTTLLNSTAYPRLTTLVWFNLAKERDWPLNSSPESASAFQAAFAGRRAR